MTSPCEPVWALGHTGRGFWSLTWGMSEGITSGVVDMLGDKLLLFDAAVYPGFSGGPVVTFHDHGRPEVAGVNHAILFTGMDDNHAASIFSAAAVLELHEVLAGRRAPLEAGELALTSDPQTALDLLKRADAQAGIRAASCSSRGRTSG